MDWFFDSAYHLSCPYDSVNSLLNTLDADCAHAPVPQQRRVRSEMSSLFFIVILLFQLVLIFKVLNPAGKASCC